ncbi:MAG: NAD(P)-dependent oxidoreductase [Porticoccaceae bacterium]|nr:MAG: NAD(P)-dependent oxidoreductase [Porticoccaceae bacterium]
MKIGFVGLGNMGNAIAVNLIKAGHKLVINDLARELQSNLELQGAKWCDDLAKLGAGCEVVFTALPGPTDVEEVMLGANGVLSGMDRGAFYIDLSTSSVATVAKVAAAAASRGVRMLDAPMTGKIKDAREASLTLHVGADAADFKACAPLLKLLGPEVLHVGPPGAGTAAKLAQT